MSGSLAMRNEPLGPHRELVAAYGSVPNLFRAQSGPGRATEAEERLIDGVVVRENGLNRRQKKSHLQGLCWHALPGAEAMGHLVPALNSGSDKSNLAVSRSCEYELPTRDGTR